MASQTALLWLHGGGFSSGGLDQKESDAPARTIAQSGRVVRTVDYRLAVRPPPWKKADPTTLPNRFPAGLHDVMDAARDLGAARRPYVIGGASAGACLAAEATLCLRDDGEPLAKGLVLAYGLFHAVVPPNAELESELHGVGKMIFGPGMVRTMNLNYVADPALLASGRVFPGGADLAGFPSALVLDAQNDRLRASGRVFAEELRAAGADVTRKIVVGSRHGFLNQPRRAAFADGIDAIQRWLADND